MTDQVGRDDRDESLADDAPPARLRARGRRAGWLRLCGYGGLVAVALLSLAVGAFFLSLSAGPISLTWLAPRIVAALDRHFAGQFAFGLQGASIASSGHGPALTVDGLVVKTDGRAILAAPRAELSLDWPSLLLGDVKLSRLEILDLDVRLSLQADGTVAVSAGADPVAATKIAPTPAAAPSAATASAGEVERVALLKTGAAALRAVMDFATSPRSPLGALDKVGLTHGRLTIDDRTIDRVIVYSDVALSLTKTDGAMRFSLGATGPAGRWLATAAARGEPGRPRSFEARVRGLTLEEISLIGGFRPSGFDTDAPLGIDMSFSLSPDNIVLDAKGAFEVGKGFFRLDEPDHEPVMIDRIAGEAVWSRHERKALIGPVQFKAGGFDMALTGEAAAPAELPPGADPGADAWTISMRLVRPTQVAPERAGEKIVVLDEGGLQARLMAGQGRVLVDRFALSGPEVRATATGALLFRGETQVSYTLDVEDAQIRALSRLWPTHVTPPVRTWFVDHIPTGFVRRAHAAGTFDSAALIAMRYERSPPDDSVTLEADVENVSLIDVLPGMAPITGVAGRVHVTGRTAAFDASSGMIEAAPGRRLTIERGRFFVADNALRPTPAVLDLKVAGSVEAVADILAIPAVASHASIPVDPGAIKGQIDGNLRVNFDIGDHPRDDATTFAIDATASNLTIDRLIGKERLEGATLRVLADATGLHVSGTGRLYGAVATLDVRRAFGEKGPAQAQVTFTFDEAARQRAGFAISGLGGPISAIVKTPLPVEDLDTHIDLDLTRTVFDNPIPGLSKPAGRPARASFVLVRRGDGIALDQFVFDAAPAQAQGVIELSKEGGLRAARLAPVRLSPGDDMRLDISRAGETLKVNARGANFDARPMLGSLIRSGGDKPMVGVGAKSAGEDVDVEFKSPIVTGHGKQILSNVDFKLRSAGGKLSFVSLTGSFGREQLAVALARAQNNLPQVEISTNDAGSFLAFLDIYRKMESGVLNASVQLGQNRADGTINVRDFFVKGEPTMRQLMAQGGATRADDRGNWRFDPDLVKVGRLQAGFSWASGRLSASEGVLSGPEIGLTFDGFVDFARDRLDLAGSYVPAYALNSLLSNIPVLGFVIAGGQHEGIFALSYRVTGSLSEPVVSVNPLSAIAPGMMRKLMGVLDGTTRIPGGPPRQ
ncbi:MAG: AsmA-like C-terminal region-containing protein [Methylocystis sp.]|uniref:AsmA-like C-terminal region-containing protein n=1 Tax=Methylocystis sp. TaxID=1911079 RepID=UPI003DA2AD73